MKALFLAGFLLPALFALSQVNKKNPIPSSAKAPGNVYAIMPNANSRTSTTTSTIDTTYLSSADFSGTGTITDPIRIKTSVIQTWLESLPGFNNNGSKYLASDFTWKTITTSPSFIQLDAPALSATATSSSSISLSWTDVDNESSYLLQRSQDNVSWTTIATPGANNSQFVNTGLTASTLYYYRVKAIGDNTTYTDSPFGSDSETTLSGTTNPTAETILFDLNNGFQVQDHPDGGGTYYSSQGNGIAQALKKIPTGADGFVYFQYIAGSGELLSLGYTNNNALEGYNRWAGGIYIFGTQVKAYGWNGSTTNLGVTVQDGYYYGFRRSGSLLEIVSSPDKTNWTVIGYSNYLADDLYIQAYFQTNNSKIKVFGLNLVSY